jgi:hypothetical protein
MEKHMPEAKVDMLMRVESQLTRSFVGYVAVLLTSTIWTLFIARKSPTGSPEPVSIAVVLLVLQVGSYLWYAIAAGAAAKILGDSGWKYVVWILAAPFLALIPIPIVSTIIGVSPLSIKFLLGGQLNSAVRDESFAGLHEAAPAIERGV